jgi:hypothetical protein
VLNIWLSGWKLWPGALDKAIHIGSTNFWFSTLLLMYHVDNHILEKNQKGKKGISKSMVLGSDFIFADFLGGLKRLEYKADFSNPSSPKPEND